MTTTTTARADAAERDVLLRLAAAQYGMFNHEQWIAAGLALRRLYRAVEHGWFQQVSQRVFRVSGSPWTWEGRVMAATLVAPGQVFAARRTALRLHGIRAWHDPRPHVAIPHDLRFIVDPRRVVVHTSRTLQRDQPLFVGPIPTTSIERALVEDGIDYPGERWFDNVCEAIRRGLVTIESMQEALDQAGRIKGKVLMREALDRIDPRIVRARSVPEVSLLNVMEEVTGMTAILNKRLYTPAGIFFAEVDVAVPELLLGAEGDSRAWHLAPSRQDVDTIRDLTYKKNHWEVPRILLRWFRTDPAFVRETIADAAETARTRLHLVPPTYRAAALR